MMGCPGPKYKNPKKLGGAATLMYINVDNADKYFARAKKAGAKILNKLEDTFYVDRRYGDRSPTTDERESLLQNRARLEGRCRKFPPETFGLSCGRENLRDTEARRIDQRGDARRSNGSSSSRKIPKRFCTKAAPGSDGLHKNRLRIRSLRRCRPRADAGASEHPDEGKKSAATKKARGTIKIKMPAGRIAHRK
jgi:hypothetical protein